MAKWRAHATAIAIGQKALADNIEEQIVEELVDEMDGLTSLFWIGGAALFAAMYAGIPVLQNIVGLVVAGKVAITWRITSMALKIWDIFSAGCLKTEFASLDKTAVNGLFIC